MPPLQIAAEDLEHQRKYREQLDKQERDREMQVKKVLEIQNKQQQMSEMLPPYKQFLPEEKIEAEFRVSQPCTHAAPGRLCDQAVQGGSALLGPGPFRWAVLHPEFDGQRRTLPVRNTRPTWTKRRGL